MTEDRPRPPKTPKAWAQQDFKRRMSDDHHLSSAAALRLWEAMRDDLMRSLREGRAIRLFGLGSLTRFRGRRGWNIRFRPSPRLEALLLEMEADMHDPSRHPERTGEP